MANENKKIVFWGTELNDYELENKRLSYKTMANTFDAVLCNSIPEVDPTIWDNVECGELCDYFNADGDYITRDEYDELCENGEECEECYKEIYQYYLVGSDALWVLKKANELVLYSELLDCYVWCVDHYGTGWDYVLTSLELDDDYCLKN